MGAIDGMNAAQRNEIEAAVKELRKKAGELETLASSLLGLIPDAEQKERNTRIQAMVDEELAKRDPAYAMRLEARRRQQIHDDHQARMRAIWEAKK